MSQSFFPDTLLRANIRGLTAYQSARSEKISARLWLDANEMPYSGHGLEGGDSDNRYPEPQPADLIKRVAEIYGVELSRLLLTRGIDEGLETLIRAFCEPGRDSILSLQPSYGYYAVAAAIQGCAYRTVALDPAHGFALDAEVVLQALEPSTKIVIICNPNNPTGNLFEAESIKTIIEATRNRCLVLIDEAYIEFAESESLVQQLALQDWPHVLVMRTFSKAWALAGLRMGVTVAHPSMIQILSRVIAPYPLSRPSIRILQHALREEGVRSLERSVQWIKTVRAEMREALAAIPGVIEVFASETNFILMRVPDALALVNTLREYGISIRNRSDDIPNTVRITIGFPKENAEVVARLKEGLL